MMATCGGSQQTCDQPTITSRVQEKMRKDEETLSLEEVKEQIRRVSECRQERLKELERCQAQLEKKKAQTAKLRENFKTLVKVPQVDVNFDHVQEQVGGDVIRGEFTISQKPSLCVKGGQALITFEEERVASEILKTPEFSVCCGGGTLRVKPMQIELHPAVKFEVHLDISKRKLKLSNVSSTFGADRIKDRLEMSFSRPSRGGGEVERVEYDRNTGTALITFLQTGVALSLAQAGNFQVDLEDEKLLQVGPVVDTQLHQYQTFWAVPRTTLLLDGVEDLDLELNVQDCLEVFFQKPSHGGGEISHIRYISKKKKKCLQALFSCDSGTVVDKTG